MENLEASYSKDGPKVLRDITFEVKSGERVGVGTRDDCTHSLVST